MHRSRREVVHSGPPVSSLTGQGAAPGSTLETLDGSRGGFELRAGALVHALAAEINEGHEVEPFVRDFPPGRRVGEI